MALKKFAAERLQEYEDDLYQDRQREIWEHFQSECNSCKTTYYASSEERIKLCSLCKEHSSEFFEYEEELLKKYSSTE